jgi:hypothetical protein
MIRSRFRWIQLFVLIISFLFILSMAFVLYKTTPIWNSIPLMLVVTGSVGLAFYLLFIFFQRSPIVILDDEFITVKYPFQTKTYDWPSVKNIVLSKKEAYTILLKLGQLFEAIRIDFENGEKLILWEHMYSNLNQLRSFISKKAAGKIRDPVPSVSSKTLVSIARRKYDGNVYTSFNSIAIFGIIFFMGYAVVSKPNLFPTIFLPVGAILFFYLLLGTQMNYFLIDDGYLIIRNHYFPWFVKEINLKDIAEVNIELPNRGSKTLRILTKDFNSEVYGGASLRHKNWNELLNDLKTIGIPVRDDGFLF